MAMAPSLKDEPGEERSRNTETIVGKDGTEFELTNECTISFAEETKLAFRMATPNAISNMFNLAGSFVTMLFVGRNLTKNEMAAVGLGFSIFNFSGRSLLVGFSLGFTALGAQSFGARNYTRVGLLVHRTFIIQLAICLPIIILWIFIKPILLLLRQDPEIVEYTASFLQNRIPSLFSVAALITVRNWMVGIGKVKAISLTTLANPVAATTACVILFLVHPVGFSAAAWCNNIGEAAAAISMISVVYLTGLHKQTWVRPQRESFNGVGEILWFSVAGSFVVWAEWWIAEIEMLIAVNMGSTEGATQSIMMLLLGIVFMFALGMGRAGGSRLGYLLGQGKWVDARQAMKVFVVSTFGMGCLMSIAVYFLCLKWVKIFFSARTGDDAMKAQREAEEVMDLAKVMAPISSFFIVIDSMQILYSCALRGMALQRNPAILFTICLYAIGLPISIYLAKSLDYGLWGLWMGKVVGMSLAVICLTIYTFGFVDYRKCSIEAIERANRKKTEGLLGDCGDAAEGGRGGG